MDTCGRSRAESKSASAVSLPRVQNLFLQRKCACGGSSGLTGSCSECEKNKLLGHPLQTKLRINEPGDEYEQEADRMAEQVMRMADSDFKLGHLQSGTTVQRRVAGDELSVLNGSMIQRQETAGEPPAVESVPLKDNSVPQDEGSTCPQPEDMSREAAEHYMLNDMNPPSQATVDKIDCEPPNPDGVYGCYVHLSDGLVIRVIVRKTDIVVGMAPLNTLTPPAATPLCFYNYKCPDGNLVLIKRECKSAPAGPIRIVQRRADPGDKGSMEAAPVVGDVLSSGGQPLDPVTREFFAPRFGHDFGSVRVHADAKAADSARSVNALAYTVGSHVVFGAGQYAPGSHAGQKLLAHELTHVVQQSGLPTQVTKAAATASSTPPAPSARSGLIQRQPKSDGPTVRDLPIFLEKLELDMGNNLLDYGHHLYQAAILHPDEPDVLKTAFSRYALGLNVLKDSYRFAGFKPDTADKLALGTGILFKGLTLLGAGELTLDFQVDIGRGVKFETNLNLGVNPKDVTDVRKADVTFGLVRRF
jgi:Domain of unknown function (DUF4157)